MASLPSDKGIPNQGFDQRSVTPLNRPPAEAVPDQNFNSNLVRDRLSSLQWVAVWFAISLLSLITLISLTLLWQWLLPVPQLPPGAGQTSGIENYKALTGLVDERIGRFFDLTVTKTLLPLFSTIIGFLLGRRSKED